MHKLVCCLVLWTLLVFENTQAALIAHWKFDNSGGRAVQDTARAYEGPLAPGATMVSNGVSGGALRLNRNDNGYVTVPNFLSFSEGNFSIAAWIKMNPGDTSMSSL